MPIFSVRLRWILATAIACSIPASVHAKPSPTDTINLAAASRGGRIVAVSSVLDNQKEYTADNLIDEQVVGAAGKGSFGWVSNRYDPINMEQVTIGFKDNAVKTIGRVVINPSAFIARERWGKDISLQASTESAEGPYEPIAEVTLRQAAVAQEFKFYPVPVRFLRLVVRTNYGSDRAVALGEVEIFENIDSGDPLGGAIARLEETINDLKQFQKTQLEMDKSTGRPGGIAPSASVNIVAPASGGKVLAVSSTFESERGKGSDPAYAKENLIDGKTYSFKEPKNSSAGWASQGFAPGEQWVTLGFKDNSIQPIGKIVINPTSDQQRERWARRIDVQVSNEDWKDAASFRTVATLRVNTKNPVPQPFAVGPFETRYVRLVFMANGIGGLELEGGISDVESNRAVALGEIEIYPPLISSGELESMISRFSLVLTDLKKVRRVRLETIGVIEVDPEPDPEPEVTAVRINDSGSRIKPAVVPPKKQK